MPETLTPQEFVSKWRDTELSERASYQAHFMDVCRMVGYETPSGSGEDSNGNIFTFEYSLKKDAGGHGFADVFLQGHFAIEYKAPGKYKDLRAAYDQLLQYREQLQNPPLLVVTDIQNWEIHTNWPNTEKRVYSFTHEDLATRPSLVEHLRNLFYDPKKLHPNKNTEQVTADAAEAFRLIANNMRQWEAEPERIAHFLTKLVFCLFAEDVSLLPTGPGGEVGIFSEIIERTRKEPPRFMRYTDELFRAMADGGEVMFAPIPYFNGTLFDDVRVEDIQLEVLGQLANAARLNWESVEPAIFGTLFERSLDPEKRSQLGAHYTSREDILLIVNPVLMRPLEREWERIQQKAAPLREKYEAALETTNRRQQTTYQRQLESLREEMLDKLRSVKVLDPACGSGNFLYVALQRLMDMEKEVIFHPLFMGLTQRMPEVHPRQMYGIEINPIAHALASIVVWIGYLQWRRINGYTAWSEPILEDLHENIVCKDAILAYEDVPPLTPPASQGNDIPPLTPPASQGEDSGAGQSFPPRSGGTEGGIEDAAKETEGGIEDAAKETEGGIPTRTSAELWEKLKPFVRDLRKNQTAAEDMLWQRLRRKQLHDVRWRRQQPVGNYIADFYCPAARLVVEVDGLSHEQQEEYDAIRTEYMQSLGLRVIRFTNGEVMQQLDAVVEQIGEEMLQSLPPRSGGTEGGSESLPSQNSLPPRSGGTEGGSENIPSQNSFPSRSGGTEGGSENIPPLTPPASQGEDSGAGQSFPPRSGGTEGGSKKPTEPDWPEVDVIIGNPPFLGGSLIRGELGEKYQHDIWQVYEGRVPGFADLVCYWFEVARKQIEQGKAKRAGLLATNSIRGGVNREVLQRIKASGDIFMAWADRPWTLEGAAVRVSMVGFDDGSEHEIMLEGQPSKRINPDLTGSVDITVAQQLASNLLICYIGTKKAGAFDIDESLALKMLSDKNASGKDNAEILAPWINGTAIVKRVDQKWIINFGELPEEDAQLYEQPFKHVKTYVFPERQSNNERRAREQWWLHRRPAIDMMEAKSKIQRFIATPRIAKYRLFRWYSSDVTPDDGTYIFARDDDYFFGVLHSKLHEVWSLRMGTSLEDRPRYTPTTTFETFPFPWSPGAEDTSHPAYAAISAAAKQLHEERDAWLNPLPPLTPPASQGEDSFPLRSGGTEGGIEDAAKGTEGGSENIPSLNPSPLREEGLHTTGEISPSELKQRTLTNLYNALVEYREMGDKMRDKPKNIKAAAWDFAPRLAELHDALDKAVCDAYGWPHEILGDEEEILRRLLALNLERAAAQGEE